MKRKIFITIAIYIILLIVAGCTAVADNNKKTVDILEEPTCTLYKIGDNGITKEVAQDEVESYINNSYIWSIEPTTLMYAADGNTSWIWESEVEVYKRAGWSLYEPVTIFSMTEERTVLREEVDDYLATGVWYETKSEVMPITITADPFMKTNIQPEKLELVLSKGLSGYGHTFYEMEQIYGINSIFAISVAELESGHGTSHVFKTKNNAFGLGPGMRFNTLTDCVYYFGNLMNNSLYYGKSIDSIGVIYCDRNWAPMIKQLIRENYSQLGY